MADINKALRPKPQVDIDKKLPSQYHAWKKAFDRQLADILPPRRSGTDFHIEVEKDADGKKKIIPWGPFYGMNRDKLLALRKILTEYFNKEFIKISHFSATAPVLLAHKPGGGIRFCVNYRGLNAIIKKDRYLLLFITEILRNIAKAKWYTKLDIIAAFY
jgi:hypothetical protein